MLYWCRIECFANLHEHRSAGLPVRLACTDFDQFVRFQASFQFANYGRGQAFVANGDDRAECMCAGAKSATLAGCETEQMNLRGGL